MRALAKYMDRVDAVLNSRGTEELEWASVDATQVFAGQHTHGICDLQVPQKKIPRSIGDDVPVRA